MKIAVVGTSNSIRVEGYFPLYQAIEYPNIVDNLSLGGSNCQLIPYSIEKYKIFDNYDFLITDTAINDGDYLAPRHRSADWLYNELYSVMSIIKEAPIRHLHLVFPYDIEYKEHYKIHCQVCQELDIPYLDIEKILSASSQYGIKDLYTDIRHISYFLSNQLAFVIKEERKRIFSAPKSEDMSACYKHKKYILYSLPDKFKGKYPVCTKSSSLLSYDYIVLKDNDTLFLDNLPKLNLESISFWSNTRAGYYTLGTENHKQNFNLFYTETHFTHFRPLPKEAFPVNKFLKLRLGLDPKYPAPLSEYTFAPNYTENNELILNSFLFSKTVSPPLKWKEKNLPDNSEQYISIFHKICSFCMAVPKYANAAALKYIPVDYVFIAAHAYPENRILRKEFLTLLKKSDNPYFAYGYAKLYLLPRKKYAAATKILEHALEQRTIINAVIDLTHCYIRLKKFDEALNSIRFITEEKHHIKRLSLLCSIYANMGLPDLFFKKAQEMLALNEKFSTVLEIADNCIIMKKYQEAWDLLQTIFEDPRSFIYEGQRNSIMQKIKEVQTYLKNT